MILTLGGWFAVLGLAALAAMTAAQRSHQAWTGALAVCVPLVCFLGLLGVIGAVATVGIATVLALGVVGMVASTPLRRAEGSSAVAATPGYAGELAGAWEAITAVILGGISMLWRASRHQHPPDELAPRRNRPAPGLAAAVPDPPQVAAPPPPPPPSNGRTSPMTTPPPATAAPGIGSGSIADLFAGVRAHIMGNKSHGMPGNHKTVKMFAEIHNYLRQEEESFAQYMSDPAQYPASVWEPIVSAASYSRASCSAFGDADNAVTALASMTVGAVAVNPGVRAPHHGELNAAQ